MGLDPSREIIWKIAASIDYKPQEIQLDANRAIQTATSQVFRGYDTFYRTQQKTQLDDKSFVNLTNKAFGNPYHYNPLFSSNFEKTVQTKLDSIIEKYDENESTLSKTWKGSLLLVANKIVNFFSGYGFKTDAQYFHDVDRKLAPHTKFEIKDIRNNPISFEQLGPTTVASITLSDLGKKSITDEDLKEFCKSIPDKVKKSIKSFNIDGAQKLTYKSLIEIGEAFPNLEDISFKDCKHLIENDDLKDYFKAYFFNEKLYSKQSHQSIMRTIGQSNFNMGTQPIYAHEEKYFYAKEYLREHLDNSLQANTPFSKHLNDCINLFIEDLSHNKLKSGDEEGSVNGARRSTLTLQDIQLLKKILNSSGLIAAYSGSYDILTSNLDMLRQTFKKRQDDLKQAIFSVNEQLSQKLQRPIKSILEDSKSKDPNIRQKAADMAVIVKAAFVDLGQSQGRFFALNDFEKIAAELFGDKLYKSTLENFRAMCQLTEVYSEEIDMATLKWMHNEHKKTLKHPTIGIAGGGPTGLFSALEFYKSGGNVQLSEARDAGYVRHQIVRLDPLWVSKLKFYLGTEFEKYFGAKDKVYLDDKPFVGNRSGDGFVECVINQLENRLLMRVMQLESYLDDKSPHSFQIYAAQAVDSEFKQDQFGRFVLHRRFQPEKAEIHTKKVGEEIVITSGIDRADDRDMPIEENIPVDIIFDVAGKHSAIREANSIFIDKTEERPHTVASFFVRGDCKSYRQEGHDFKRQYLVDKEFVEKVSVGIKESISQFTEKNFTDKPALRRIVNQLTASALVDFKMANFARHAVAEGNENPDIISNVYETRTFVNVDSRFCPDPKAPPRPDGGVLKFLDNRQDYPDNIVYLGMEIPVPLDQLYKKLKGDIAKALKDSGYSDEDVKRLTKTIVDEANLSFVMSVAKEQGLDRPIDDSPESKPWVSKEYADRKFLGTFMVSQGSQPQGISIKKGDADQSLIMASGGDCAASPHFMRYSGLSGGREHVAVMSNLVERMSMGQLDDQEKAKEFVDQCNKQYKHINEFVLSRGKVFLPQASPEKISDQISDEILKLIEKTLAENKPEELLNLKNVLQHQLLDELRTLKGTNPNFDFYIDSLIRIITRLDESNLADYFQILQYFIKSNKNNQ